MPRLIWVFAGRTDHFVGFIMRRCNWYLHVIFYTIFFFCSVPSKIMVIMINDHLVGVKRTGCFNSVTFTSLCVCIKMVQACRMFYHNYIVFLYWCNVSFSSRLFVLLFLQISNFNSVSQLIECFPIWRNVNFEPVFFAINLRIPKHRKHCQKH